MRHLWILSFLLAPAVAAAQEGDDIELYEGDLPKGKLTVTSMTYEKVVYTITPDDGQPIANQIFDAWKVKRLSLRNKPADLAQGEDKMDSDPDAAVRHFRNLLGEGRTSDLVKQFAYYYLAECQTVVNREAARQTIDEFRTKMPNSFFLKHTYEMVYDLSRSKKDAAGMSKAIEDLRKKGEELRQESWKKAADLKQAELHEFKQEWQQAFSQYGGILSRYRSDPRVADEARLGELRCLGSLGDSATLESKANAILAEFKEKKRDARSRLLMGAYLALGDAKVKSNVKAALLLYMRVVVLLGPRYGDSTPEHEAGIAKAAIASAFHATASKDEVKQTYRQRAEQLMDELKRTYGEGSLWMERVKKAVVEIK